ncbi:MAG: hypothetical protein WKF84_05790 [Pyrinomonadaceae bacterium]
MRWAADPGAPVSYARQAYAAAEPPASTRDESSDTQEPQKPGLVERFKETKAFDRLQQEVGSLGDRFVDELSHTAQAVVLPALLGKLKDMIGIDLGAQQKEAKRSSSWSKNQQKLATAQWMPFPLARFTLT